MAAENSELVKNYERIRDYMRQFYVYGFRSRTEIRLKSPRSYDNERRRIESWLGDYICFRRDEGGKRMYLSLDSRTLEHNPLYQAFKAKSFTDKDITLHFYILDCLSPGRELSLMQLVDEMDEDYLAHFPDAEVMDVSTLRKKLKEYETLGLVRIRRQGKEYLYSRSDADVPLDRWAEALDYFSEAAPLGVVGSFLLDRLPRHDSPFRFKHHYLLHTLDSHILCDLLDAMQQHRWATLTTRNGKEHLVYPCSIYVSSQTGRQYLLAFVRRERSFRFFRLDTIHKVKAGSVDTRHEEFRTREADFAKYLWGVSARQRSETDHLEMTIHADPREPFILQRLLREKRNGRVTVLDEETFLFQTDVYDALEMMSWIRTFLGRIVKLECSNPLVMARFRQDLEAMDTLYGGE